MHMFDNRTGPIIEPLKRGAAGTPWTGIAAFCLLLAVWAVAGSAACAGLPSDPGRVFKALTSVAPGEWRGIGAPAADPECGRARGRAWTSSMPYADSLGGAFLYGEGVHGWSNTKNHRYMDDLWFYDANAHAWVNMYPGSDMRKLDKVRLTEDGFESFDGERPVPIGMMVHGYEMTAWDPHRQILYAMEAGHVYLNGKAPGLAAFRQAADARSGRRSASPWMFDPWNRKWHRVRTRTPSPGSQVGDVTIYLPGKREVFHYRNRRVAFYDPAANAWRVSRPDGPQPAFGIDPTACYDARRDCIYIGGGQYPVAGGRNALWIFDAKTERWIDPGPAGSPGGNSYGTNVAIMNCDARADKVVLIRHRGAARGVHVYDPARNAWADEVRPLPANWSESAVSGGFYHPGNGLHYVFSAGDSEDNGTMSVFRPSR
jgi:hypothetical protein